MNAFWNSIQSVLGLGIETKELTFLNIAARGLIVFVATLIMVVMESMGLVSLLMGLFFSLATDRLYDLEHGVRLAIGTLSTAFGVWMVVEIGFIQGLFLA